VEHEDAANLSAVTVDTATQQPLYGAYTRNNGRPDPFTDTLQDYALTVHWRIADFATLTNAASFSRMTDSLVYDATTILGPLVPLFTGGARPAEPADYAYSFDLKKWTEELRLESPANQRTNWIVGAFFTHETSTNNQLSTVYTSAGTADPAVPLLLGADFPGTYRESAAFANATYKITTRLDVSAGVRYAKNSQIFGETQSGVLAGPGVQGAEFRADASVVTWSASSSFHVQPDSMFYVRVASGYRPGGPNAVPGAPEVPSSYEPDKLINYEGGFKGSSLDKRLQFDAATFYLVWSKIQLTGSVPPTGFIYTANAGRAVSRGIELSTAYQASRDLLLALNYTYTDAHLTEDAPVVGGKDGDQLPGSPKNAASLTAQYRHQLAANLSLLLGAAYVYRGPMYYQVQSSPTNVKFDAMDRRIDLYAGAEVAKNCTVRVFAKNVLGEQSYNNAGTVGYSDATHQGVVPDPARTIGISVDAHF
jgi:iron complex outermembrane recepter protein